MQQVVTWEAEPAMFMPIKWAVAGDVAEEVDPQSKLTGKAFFTPPNWFVKPPFTFNVVNDLLSAILPEPEPPIQDPFFWHDYNHGDTDNGGGKSHAKD